MLKTIHKNLTLIILFVSSILSLYGNCQTWNSLGTGVNSNVYSFAEDTVNHQLYIGGWFSIAGGSPATRIAKWDGTSWTTVGTGMSNGGANDVRCLLFFNGELFAGGGFDSAGGVAARNIAKWDGNSWDSVGAGFIHGSVMTLAEYNGELYAGGYFDSSGTARTNHIAKWDGTNWVEIGGGTDNTVLTLCTFNNELYVGGMFSSVGSVNANRVAKWNGLVLDTVGVGFNDWVRKLYVYNNELYAGGDFTPFPNNNSRIISKWNGTAWQAFANPSGGNYPAVRDMVNYNGEFYIVGEFTSPSYIGKYNGSGYSSLGSGLSWVGGTLQVFNNELYVAGYFVSAGGVSNTGGVARWNSTTGVFENIFTDVSFVYPNPSAGNFVIELGRTITKGTIQIFNTLGESVFVGNVFNESKKEINLKNISDGVYFVKVFDGEKYDCKKISIEQN